MQTRDEHLVLRALFLLCRRDVSVHYHSLTVMTALDAPRLDAAVLELERAGLVNSDRLRLTLAGLAVATALESAQSGATGPSRTAAPPLPQQAVHLHRRHEFLPLREPDQRRIV